MTFHEAAKQIKELINDSMTKVASGDAQVKVTYSTMQDIVSSIENVNELVGKIAIASNEQSSSIEQINVVISQLEGNTQQNAAQVEEVAASAELLKEQSSKLVGIVHQFNIDKENQERTGTPRFVDTHSKQKKPIKTERKDKKPASNETNISSKPALSSASKIAGAKNASVLDTEHSWKEF